MGNISLKLFVDESVRKVTTAGDEMTNFYMIGKGSKTTADNALDFAALWSEIEVV